MHGLEVEHRSLGSRPLSADLADHLSKRCWHGRIVVVTDKPKSLMVAVRKKWLHLIRKIENERARTLNAETIILLTGQIDKMRHLGFDAKPPADFLMEDVTFAEADDLKFYTPDCATMYICCAVPKETQHMITSWMPRRGLVVIYEI